LPSNCNPLRAVCVFDSQAVPRALAPQHGRPLPRERSAKILSWG
jgi:hypothetical protein